MQRLFKSPKGGNLPVGAKGRVVPEEKAFFEVVSVTAAEGLDHLVTVKKNGETQFVFVEGMREPVYYHYSGHMGGHHPAISSEYTESELSSDERDQILQAIQAFTKENAAGRCCIIM